jgi:ABC-type Fe3+/spermidine/putrescine transport system ATPase subunit
MTVDENVAIGLKMQSRPTSEVTERVAKILAQVNLPGMGRRPITDLSGGEQQRVALARALAPEPRLLMFDEPLGALDRNLREHLMVELRSILRASRVPAIYVTHDQEEAFTLADRVLLLHEGQIVRSGTPAEVWRDPGSAWVASFLGVGNVVDGVLRADGRVGTPVGVFAVKCAIPHRVGETVTLLLRPTGAWPVDFGGGTVPEGCVSGTVTDVVFQRERYKVSLSNGLSFGLADPAKLGEEICLELPPSAIVCLT